MRTWISRVTVAFVVLAALTGCDQLPTTMSSGDLAVADVVLGRSLAPDGTIVEEAKTNQFWATDTFYVSVVLPGTADNVPVTARWTDGAGAVVAESSKTVARGTTIVPLEAPPPKDGRWPEGDYKVEILVNGQSKGVKDLHAR